MHTALDCIPCLVRQALEAARFVTTDRAVHERLVREALLATAAMDFGNSPVVMAQRIHRMLRDMAGVHDPYRAVKDRFNGMALSMLAQLEEDLAQAADPLALALRLAIAGNVIDLGVNGNLTEPEARRAIVSVLNEPFHGDIASFCQAVKEARSILYLADNAGEIVFDRLLIERLPTDRVVVAVRGGPVLNDATMPDAKAAGLSRMVEVIDNGSDAPGTVLGDCDHAFRQRFADADLIIAKGQGNFETLSDETANLWFLLKVKCPVIAGSLGLPVGTHVLTRRMALVSAGGENHARC